MCMWLYLWMQNIEFCLNLTNETSTKHVEKVCKQEQQPLEKCRENRKLFWRYLWWTDRFIGFDANCFVAGAITWLFTHNQWKSFNWPEKPSNSFDYFFHSSKFQAQYGWPTNIPANTIDFFYRFLVPNKPKSKCNTFVIRLVLENRFDATIKSQIESNGKTQRKNIRTKF